MASFETRGNKVRAIVFISGKKQSETFATKKDAQMWATAQERRRDLGDVVELPSHDTLAAVIKSYTTKDGKWAADKQQHLDKLASGDLGRLPLSKLNRSTIVDHIIGLELSPWNTNSRVSYLASALKFAKYKMKLTVRMGEFLDAREELGKAGHKAMGRSIERTRKTNQEEIDLIAGCAGDRSNSIDFAEVLGVLAVLPIRVGELLKIKWTDIDHKTRTVTLRNRKHPDPKVKARNDEVIPLLKVGGVDTFDLVVTNRAKYGNQDGPFPYLVRQVSSAMTEARKAAGLGDSDDKLRVHDLRAHAITKMLKAKVNPMVVMQISGHKNPVVFFKHYVRFDAEDVRQAVEEAMAA